MPDNEEVAPTISYADALGSEGFRHGYIKCRLVHLSDRSFVMPDVLMASGMKKMFFSPQFFTANRIAWFGGDGAADHCTFVMELLGQVEIKIAFFQNGLVKRCDDRSFIYKCAFRVTNDKPFPEPQGIWRRRSDRFELALYHHTNATGEAGIHASGEIWSSSWNIQGTQKLKNIAYGYFTSLPKIENILHLMEVAMSETGVTHFLPTNAPMDAMFAHPLKVYRQQTRDRDRRLRFWVDTETISPSHLWLHRPMSEPAYYEVVLPKVFRVGVEPAQTLPFKGTALTIKPEDCKNFPYAIVGDADTQEGLTAPYHEEETLHLAKVDYIPEELEILGRWYQKQNTYLFPDMEVELAELIKDRT
ncbi:hypothetical protein ACEWPL_015170 [Roseovarius sp. S1116L3]|uniref:hypothetical protein n=1 Tax=Roseovarius roseus TaxID=3342636 RepID=UPI0037292A41